MDDEINEKISLYCVFCKSTSFVVPSDDYQPQPGEMLTCGNCGRENDYDSLMRLAKERALQIAEEKMSKMLKDALKGTGFKIR